MTLDPTKVLTENRGLIHYYIRKHRLEYLDNAIDIEDLEQRASEAIVRYLHTYDPARGPLAKFLSFHIRRAINDERAQTEWDGRARRRDSLVEGRVVQPLPEDAEEWLLRDDNQRDIELRLSIEALPEPERTIIERRLAGDTWQQINALFGWSDQMTARNKAMKALESLGIDPPTQKASRREERECPTHGLTVFRIRGNTMKGAACLACERERKRVKTTS